MSQTKTQLVEGLNINTSAPATALQIDASGNINLDSNTLYVDATNNRVGLGTSSPSGPIHVTASSNGFISHTFSNTSNGSSAVNRIQIGNDASDGTGQIVVYGSQHSTLANIFDINNAANAAMRLLTNNTERVRITSGGNVGIGTTNPTDQLHVVGNILAIASSGNRYVEAKSGSSGVQLACDGNTNFIYGYGAIPLTFSTNGGEKARITSDGKLLVGTSSSSLSQQIESASTGGNNLGVIRYNNGSGGSEVVLAHSRSNSIGTNTVVSSGDRLGDILFKGGDGTNYIEAASISAQVDGTPGANDMPGRLVFSTTADGASSPTERMRIRADGSILMGGITGLPDGTNIGMAWDMTGDKSLRIGGNTTGGDNQITFYNPNGVVGSISTSGSGTAYTTSSDYRLKENIVPLTGAIDRLQQIPVHRFNFIADPDKTVDGFIAHEAQAVVPECVTGTKDEVDENGNPVYQGIDQSKLVPLLTAALQEALVEIESLKARVTALEP